MKKDEVKVGETYIAKVSDKLVSVRIDSANSHGGWNATNIATGKRIRIKSAQRLRSEADGMATPGDAAQSPAEGKKAKARKGGGEKKPKGEPKAKRVSALDAAATVLQKAGEPMKCADMITKMGEQGLWSSPGGKTPAATLYSAILREVAAKGKDARFKKTDRGQFAFNG